MGAALTVDEATRFIIGTFIVIGLILLVKHLVDSERRRK